MLKRVVFLVVLAAFVVAVSWYNTAEAGPKVKTMVCHCNLDVDDDPALPWFVIEVADPAVPAHLNHGDCLADPALEVGAPCVCP